MGVSREQWVLISQEKRVAADLAGKEWVSPERNGWQEKRVAADFLGNGWMSPERNRRENLGEKGGHLRDERPHP